MLFSGYDLRRPSKRRPFQFTAVFALTFITLDLMHTYHQTRASDWDYLQLPQQVPTIDWSATPPAGEKRLRNRPLDMSYPEVATILEYRMKKHVDLETIRSTAAQIVRLCHLLNFQPSFILAVIEHESSFNPKAVSSAGATGLMQLLPATARIVGDRMGISISRRGQTLKDPVINVTLGMHYLAELHDDFKTLASTLAAYNLGPERWAKLLRQPASKRPKGVIKYVALIQRTSLKIQKKSQSAWKPQLAKSQALRELFSSSVAQ